MLYKGFSGKGMCYRKDFQEKELGIHRIFSKMNWVYTGFSVKGIGYTKDFQEKECSIQRIFRKRNVL